MYISIAELLIAEEIHPNTLRYELWGVLSCLDKFKSYRTPLSCFNSAAPRKLIISERLKVTNKHIILPKRVVNLQQDFSEFIGIDAFFCCIGNIINDKKAFLKSEGFDKVYLVAQIKSYSLGQ